VFVPNLAELGTLHRFAAGISLFLLDHCSSHATSDVIGLLGEARVGVITFPPHTSQIFQGLDLTLFGILKTHSGYELRFEEEATVEFILRSYHDFEHSDLSLTHNRSHPAFYSVRAAQRKPRLSRAVVDRLPAGSIVRWAAWCSNHVQDARTCSNHSHFHSEDPSKIQRRDKHDKWMNFEELAGLGYVT
jgi:hypothetical protein